MKRLERRWFLHTELARLSAEEKSPKYPFLNLAYGGNRLPQEDPREMREFNTGDCGQICIRDAHSLLHIKIRSYPMGLCVSADSHVPVFDIRPS
ncbi:hypothetical protein BaRGS_00034137, partial [Batillaria attramentaria]